MISERENLLQATHMATGFNPALARSSESGSYTWAAVPVILSRSQIDAGTMVQARERSVCLSFGCFAKLAFGMPFVLVRKDSFAVSIAGR